MVVIFIHFAVEFNFCSHDGQNRVLDKLSSSIEKWNKRKIKNGQSEGILSRLKLNSIRLEKNISFLKLQPLRKIYVTLDICLINKRYDDKMKRNEVR